MDDTESTGNRGDATTDDRGKTLLLLRTACKQYEFPGAQPLDVVLPEEVINELGAFAVRTVMGAVLGTPGVLYALLARTIEGSRTPASSEAAAPDATNNDSVN